MNKEKAKHADLGASSCERWWTCPGSVDFLKKFPKEKASSYAAEGTVAHEISSHMLTNLFTPSEPMKGYAQMGDVVECDGHKIEVTDEMLEAVDVYVNYVKSKVKEYDLKPKQIFIEFPIDIKNSMKKELYGTADCVLHVPFDRLIVIDYKHGKGRKVDVSNNKQLMYYALGVLNALKPFEKAEIETIEIVVVQPRCMGGGISSVEMPLSHLESFYSNLMTHVAAVKPDAPLVAGNHCEDYYCAARSSCPTLQKFLDDSVGQKFAMIKVKKDLRDIDTLSLEEKLKILSVKDLIKKWLDAIFVDVLNQANNGTTIPGWGLVAGKSNRAWIDEKKAREELLKHFKAEEVLSPGSLLGIPAIEKLVEKAKLENFDLSTLVIKPKGKNTLAPLSDGRALEQPKVVKAFEGLKVKNDDEA
jgi:hypothetical protein